MAVWYDGRRPESFPGLAEDDLGPKHVGVGSLLGREFVFRYFSSI